jgi:hypothetical protein
MTIKETHKIDEGYYKLRTPDPLLSYALYLP